MFYIYLQCHQLCANSLLWAGNYCSNLQKRQTIVAGLVFITLAIETQNLLYNLVDFTILCHDTRDVVGEIDIRFILKALIMLTNCSKIILHWCTLPILNTTTVTLMPSSRPCLSADSSDVIILQRHPK
jgi:hypothetical protein